MMKSKWVIAGAAALALSLLTLPMLRKGGQEHLGRSRAAADAENGPTCDVESNTKGKLDFVLKDMNNTTVRMADYKGKVVLLNFWATWCGPCKVEIPSFVELYDRYRDQGLVIAGVSIDDAPDTLRAFAKEWRMQYPILLMQSDVEDSYGPFYGIPTSFVIARDGTICTKHIGPASKERFEQEIKALL
jgi:cytochrome c biogenesis protein CcmG/thiol:disulfide interchange protein DsbE